MLFFDLHPTTRRLLLARGLRSIGQGMLVVDWALYLQALGWNGVAIGAVLSGTGLFGAALSLLVGLVRDERRRLATSLNAVLAQLPQSVGPTIAGYLLDAGQLTLPFYIAAVLQGIYLVWYDRVFRQYEPPRENLVRPSRSGSEHKAKQLEP